MVRNADFRREVLDRDGRSCIKCGYKPSSSDRIHAHHITPLDHGGEDLPENGVALCNTCHRYAPDWDTVVDPDRYPEAFDIFQSTMNPPQSDMFWFGLMAADNGFLDSGQYRGATALEVIPHLDDANWWVVLAAIADYKNIRSIIPLVWPDDPSEEWIQQKISASQRY